MARTIRFGIIGLGRMGQKRLETIRSHPDTVAVVGCDPSDQAGRIDGLRRVSDPSDVFAADVDAVFICTPNRYAPALVVAALDSGKHVFSEKPPGRTIEDVEEMMKAEARNPGLTLKFGFNHRYHLAVTEAKTIVDSQRYGRLLWARGVYGKGERPRGTTDWRDDPVEAGGGILLDQGIHMLDLLRHFLGDFAEIKSMCASSFWNLPLEDNAFALLRTADGRIASLHSSFTQWKHLFRLEIGMSDGYVIIEGMPSSTRSYRDERLTHARRRTSNGFTVGNPPEETVFFNSDPSWNLELTEFIDCIRRESPSRHGTSNDAYEAMRMVREIYGGDASFRDQIASSSSSAPGIFP